MIFGIILKNYANLMTEALVTVNWERTSFEADFHLRGACAARLTRWFKINIGGKMMSAFNNDMKVVILTAGYGRRMQPLSNETHKTLLNIGEKTVIQRIIDALLEWNITDLNIVTGYRADELKVYLKQTYPTLNINYIHNHRFKETNNIYSLALALENLTINKDIVLIESDLIFDPSVIARLIQSPHGNVALVDRYRSGMDGTVVTVDEERGTITNVIPPHLQGKDFSFQNKYKTLNIYRFSQEFCQTTFKKLLTYYAQAHDHNCYYELILGVIIYLRKVEVFAEILDGEKWAEVDDPNDLDIARFIFDKSAQRKILESSFGAYWNYDILDYCFIRNMYFPTDAILSDLKNNLIPLIHNYSSTQKTVERKLATYLLCEAERVVALNGASQIYPILEQYLAPKRALIPCPTFGEYNRIFPNNITYSDAVGIDEIEILHNIHQCDILVIVNPNNPTGSTLSTEWIYNLAASYQDKIIVLDESFIDFSPQFSILLLLEAKPLSNIILIKSLSKVLGVPGMRLGYVYSANHAFNSYARSKIPIWNFNSLAEYFLEIILKYRQEVLASFQKTICDRQEFSRELQALPIVEKVYPSGANFLLVSLDCDSNFKDSLIELLLTKHGIYVKDISKKFNSQKSYLRLAVRDAADNRKFTDCFHDVVREIQTKSYAELANNLEQTTNR